MQVFLLSMSCAFLLSVALAPIVIKLAKRLKASQSILQYVELHKSKEGTPTMGGFIFIVAIVAISILFLRNNSQLATVALATMCAFGLLGFLDDFLKVKNRHNLGLRAYQKALGQFGISIIIAFFAYNSGLIGSSVIVPFCGIEFNLSIWFIPFTIFVLLAITNSVNLTDGLDGLSTGTSLAYLTIFAILLLSIYTTSIEMGESAQLISEQKNLIFVIFISIGALLGFWIYNFYPAKIFMGDVGSLALGGLIASVSIFTRFTLLMPLVGFVFVLSAVSVIIQVLHYKRTKRRIFLMAPFHHHLEKLGIKETKITIIYTTFTFIIGATCLAFML